MGEQNVAQEIDHAKLNAFIRALIRDVWAIEQMLENNLIESGIRRAGAEQEMFLVDRMFRPAPAAFPILQNLNHSQFTTELAKFNLEVNLHPFRLTGSCLRRMEQELEELIARAREAANACNADIILTGILPSLRLADLTLNNMTESPRYYELNRMLSSLRKKHYYVHLKGIDEIQITHENMMLEACNTSFQLHYQVGPEEFVDLYNLAQAITAPVLAAAVNSPLLFGRRLWAETRLALFQHSVDERSELEQSRHRSPRVSFGEKWLESSVVELFRQDIARYRVLLTHAVDEDPGDVLARGEVPRLSALRLHNGTVWRWNRPCYGIMDGIPHLRIENRVLPAGPSILDEVSNAAFFFGLMSSLKEEYGPISRVFEFDHAKANFVSAARHGLNAELHWINGSIYSASELILTHLLPLARAGLKSREIESEDIDRYLGVIEERVKTRRTGAQWMLKSLASMADQGTPDLRLRTLTAAILNAQKSNLPAHQWPVPEVTQLPEDHEQYRTVGQLMSTELFTVRPDDIADYVASIMHWEHLRYLPVEDDHGNLVGLVSQRNLLLLLAQGSALNRAQAVQVSRIMKKNPITVTPDTPTLEAIQLLREKKIGCLPVLRDGKLVGIITLFDLLSVSAKLLEDLLKKS